MTIKVCEVGYFPHEVSWGYIGEVNGEQWFFDCSEATSRAIAKASHLEIIER